MGTAAIYTGYQIYSHYKENHTPAPVEVLPKESSNVAKKPNLPQNNNRPPELVSSAAVLQQIAQSGSKKVRIKKERSTVINPTKSFYNNSNSDILDLQSRISKWLGKDTKLFFNRAGDPIFISKDGTRKIRFDFMRPHPHISPHMHIEQMRNNNWKELSRIYPSDVPHK